MKQTLFMCTLSARTDKAIRFRPFVCLAVNVKAAQHTANEEVHRVYPAPEYTAQVAVVAPVPQVVLDVYVHQAIQAVDKASRAFNDLFDSIKKEGRK